MSALIVQVCEVLAVEPHPSADRLAIATVKGWKTCIKFDPVTGRAEFEIGDKCVYFPPDSVLPSDLAERLGVTEYLKPLPKESDGTRPSGYQVWAAYLRGVPSYGLIIPAGDNPAWAVGTDVTEYYGVTKFEPPTPVDPNAIPDHSALIHYTNLEAAHNFPGVLRPGENVVVTEKIHGTNFRAGLVRTIGDAGNVKWEWIAGSFNTNQRQFDANGYLTRYWQPLQHPGLRSLLEELSAGAHDALVFGEIFGPGIMDMHYGRANPDFCVFDIAVDREYIDFDRMVKLCATYGVPVVPILYQGPYYEGLVEQYVTGPTRLCQPEEAGRFKGREGVVIKPSAERRDLDTLGGRGRVILKAHSVDFLRRKSAKDGH